MGIDTFIANFQNGARANRFRVAINWPGLVGTPNVRDDIVVSAAALPSSIVGVVQVPYMGRQIPIPGDRTFEDWTITILNDTSFSHRNAFERWSNAILSHRGNIQASPSYRDFVTNISVVQLDRADTIIKTFTLRNAWPTNITQIDLGYDQNDTIETYTVTFAYTDWDSPNSPIS